MMMMVMLTTMKNTSHCIKEELKPPRMICFSLSVCTSASAFSQGNNHDHNRDDFHTTFVTCARVTRGE